MVVYCPSNLDVDSINDFVSRIYAVKDAEIIQVSLRDLSFAKPYATLKLCLAIRSINNFRRARELSTITLTNLHGTGAHSYLMHIGFFRACRYPLGKKPGEARGSRTYTPITIIDINKIHLDESKPFQEDVKATAISLAEKLFSSKEKDLLLVNMLGYCLTETIRNCFEHSEVSKCLVVAQKWSKGGKSYAQVAIADEGIGIPKSLEEAHEFASPAEALRQSLLPGITRDTSDTTNNFYQNSGFGLYVLSTIGKELGDFSITSGGQNIRINSEINSCCSIEIPGTVVSLTVELDEVEYFTNHRQKIILEGEKLLPNIKGAIDRGVSASKLPESW